MSEQRRFSIKDDLGKNVFSGFAKFQIALALMIFLPAWSPDYWQGWVYWLLFGTCCVVVTLYFLRHDRALIAGEISFGNPGGPTLPDWGGGAKSRRKS